MKKSILFLVVFMISVETWAQSSMRRCSLLPVTDSVGGAIGFKVFEEVEIKLKRSNWCTYVSNSSIMSVFSKYRDNLSVHLKSKQVLGTIAEKLKVGSLVRITITNEVDGVELQTDVVGENGEDLYFSEKMILKSNDIETISNTVNNWLNLYAKMIPYDAKINGILGDQVTLDVGKGYPIVVGQKFLIKRMVSKKMHPFLKKVVDWDTEVLAEGAIHSISDNQALGVVKVYKTDKKLTQGDWVRLLEEKQAFILDKNIETKEDEMPGVLGLFSLAMLGSSSSVDTTTPSGSRRMSGNLFGIDLRAEGWITRQYFAAIELIRTLGTLSKKSGTSDKNSVNSNNSALKVTGGYKYLPVGFFYGPQIDLYGGYANYTYDLDFSSADGFGEHSFSGLLLGTAANVPLSREFRVFAKAEFLPFPSFNDGDSQYNNAKSVSAMELEVGLKYNYTPRISLDGSVQTISRKAKFSSGYKEASYKDNFLKFGVSFNF
jgi:hypothetical protein